MKTKSYVVATILFFTSIHSLYAESSGALVHTSIHCKGNKNGFFIGGELGGHLPIEKFDLIPYLSFSITPYSKPALVKTGPAEYYQFQKVRTMFDLGLRQEFSINGAMTLFLKAGLGRDGGYFKGTQKDFDATLLFQSEAGVSAVISPEAPFMRFNLGGGVRTNRDITYPSFTLSFSVGI